jgi:hypothetical protein
MAQSSSPPYNLRDQSTINVANHLGFSTAGVVCEPSSYQEAVNLPVWQNAMSDELHALQRIDT